METPTLPAQEWANEKQHLADTLQIVRSERQKLENDLGIVDGNDRLIQVLDDGSTDAEVQQFVIRNKLRSLHQLRLSSRQPYFARLDFMPDPGAPVLGHLKAGEKSSIYLGRWGVLETPSYQVRVADWRSPVANLYYSGQIGRVSYEAPDGKVEGELSLKRMFTISDGQLEDMQDTGLAGQEKYLTDALSQMTSARLREVVTTIQSEQNTVIRFDAFSPLCVQGVAGSGKTTIALHRMAWLLYQLQKTVLPQQMLILAPNPLFLSYISRVLPDLGVDDVRQTTFPGLCRALMGKRMPRLMESARLPERLQMDKAQRDELDNVLRRKGALSLRAELAEFLTVWEHQCLPKADIKFLSRTLMTTAEIQRYFWKEFRHFPLESRVQEVRKVLKKRLARVCEETQAALERKVDEMVQKLMRTVADCPGRRARARLYYDTRDQRIQELKDRQKAFFTEFDGLWGSMDLLTVYGAFWEWMAEKDAANEAVLTATRPALQKKQAQAEDLPALLILAQGLYGLNRMNVRQVVVDEAQDVSPLEVRVLRELFRTDAFTLVGDLCQGIYGDEGIRSWEDLSAGIFEKPVTVTRLGTAYRSTVEIMETAFSVIARHPVAGEGAARPVERHGEKPFLISVKTPAERASAVKNAVRRWQDEGFENIAIIVKTGKAAAQLQKALAALGCEARLVCQGDNSFQGGVQVMDASIVKGLEFDCVLIADAEAAQYPDERFYAKLFYVLCTRPLHRLGFVSLGERTVLLTGAELLQPEADAKAASEKKKGGAKEC